MAMQIGGGVQFSGGAYVNSWPQTYYTSTGSVSFNGSSYLSTPSTSGSAFGTGNFTVELWFNNNSTGFYTNLFATVLAYSTSNTLRISTGGTNNTLQVASGGTVLLNASTTFNNSVWNHIALVRNSGTLTLYLNGVSVGSTTDNTSYVAGPFVLGNVTGVGGPYYFNGYMSNVRVTNTAVYTSAFTPSTTPLTAIAGTALLTCQSSSTITDASTNAFTITNNGTAVATTSNPFIGGSASFNGTNQYLTVPANAGFNIGTGNFTLEAWINVPNTQVGAIFATGPTASKNGFYISATGQIFYTIFNTGNYQIGTATVSANTWTHVAIVRVGSTMTAYINGTSIGTITNSSSVGDSTTVSYVGQFNSGNFFNGYISNFRFNNTAVYTANFTPSTAPLTAVTGTALLTCQSSSTITDASTNAFAITNSGVTATGISPFNAVASTY